MFLQLLSFAVYVPRRSFVLQSEILSTIIFYFYFFYYLLLLLFCRKNQFAVCFFLFFFFTSSIYADLGLETQFWPFSNNRNNENYCLFYPVSTALQCSCYTTDSQRPGFVAVIVHSMSEVANGIWETLRDGDISVFFASPIAGHFDLVNCENETSRRFKCKRETLDS